MDSRDCWLTSGEGDGAVLKVVAGLDRSSVPSRPPPLLSVDIDAANPGDYSSVGESAEYQAS